MRIDSDGTRRASGAREGGVFRDPSGVKALQSEGQRELGGRRAEFKTRRGWTASGQRGQARAAR